MAKFCGNCGAELDDNARVCGQCGTPVEEVASNYNNVIIVDPEKQKKNQKTLKLIIVAVAVVVVVIIALNIVLNLTGYKGLIRKAMKAYENYDIDTLVSLSSDIYYYGYDGYAEYYFKYNVGDDLDAYESRVGHNYKLSYKIDGIYALSDRKQDTLIDEISFIYSDFNTGTIKKVMVADLTITAKAGSKSMQNSIQITMSKEEDGWKILYID